MDDERRILCEQWRISFKNFIENILSISHLENFSGVIFQRLIEDG